MLLELERLNDQSFDELVEKAVKSIARFDTEWNNLQASDPGMTLVDLFAWLKAMQHEYMSVIVPESRRRFLSLLDIAQRRGRGSSAVIGLSGAAQDTAVPALSQWTAGDMVFENPDPVDVLAAQISGVRFGAGDVVIPHDMLDGGRIFDVFPGLGPEPLCRPEGEMTLYLSRPIPPGRTASLYFDLDDGGVCRTPVGQGKFFPMAEIAWEIWTEKGWEAAEVVRDDTHELLFSGLIALRHSAEMACTADGYALRARLIRDDYDLPPRVRFICLNAAEVRQQDTLVQCDVLEAGASPELKSRLGLYGRHRVFVQDGGWREVANFQCEPLPEQGSAVLHLPESGRAILALSYDERVESGLTLGSGTGFSGQELPFEHKDALYDSVRLLVGRRTPDGLRYDEWEKCDDFYSSGPQSKHFVLDAERGQVRFGDHMRGVMPPKGDGNILLAGLKTCRGRDSDVRLGRISAPCSTDARIAALHVRQLTAATGGEDAESFEETAARAADALRAGGKAVTEGDYLAAVRAVPGLIIEGCRVLTGFAGESDRAVTVVVQGAGRARRTPREAYVQNIRAALDTQRLINTQIRVVWPRPVRLLLRARIVTAPYYHDAGAAVRRRVEQFIASLNRSFGAPLSYGELYCAIDLLECVSSIEQLSVEPLGEWIARTGTDDIIVAPNSVYEIERFDLKLFSSLE